MQARRQFDMGVDAARNDAALKRAESSRPGRLPSRTARSLTAVLLVTFAAIFLPLQAEAQTGICGRTEAVRTAILNEIPGITACGNVTDAHLAAITGTLRLRNKGISALAAGDFDGLTELTALDLAHNNLSTLSAGVFDELTALEILLLHSNSLTTLSAGVFDELTELSVLDLASNSLTTLSAGVFEELTELTALYLNTNSLTTLPAGVFDELTELTVLYLRKNSLSTFPDDVFEELTALTNLQLQDNPGAPFSPTADALPDAGTVPVAGGNVTLDGSGSGGPWGTNVTYSWRQTSGPTSGVTFDDAASATPVVTIPVLTASTELTFTLTVTGRATDTSRGAVPGADTATVTAPAANASPSFTSPATFSAAENQTAVGTVAASDSDTDDSVTGYAIHGGADALMFSIVEATGTLTFASAPNFEAPADADTGNDYVVVVRATSGTGERVKTAEVTITVTVTDMAGEAPGVPAAPSVSSASVTSLTVTWTAPTNAGPAIGDYDYRYRVTSPQGSWTEVTNTTIAALGATITGLEEDTEYDVQVRATNDEGTSGWSASGTGATEAGAIANAPENLQTTAGNAQVTLRWDAPGDDGGADITGYAYRYKESGGDFIAYMDIPDSGPGEANTRSYTVTGLTNGQEYVFQVRAENEHGGGSPAEVTVMLPSRVSTESEELPTEVVLMGNYPNPFNPETTIRYALPQTGNVHLAVYDLLGHEVAVLVDEPKPAGHHATRFDAGDLPSGAYIYRLQAQDKIMVQIMILVK